MWFLLVESEMLSPSLSFVSAEVKARYDVLSCLNYISFLLEFH